MLWKKCLSNTNQQYIRRKYEVIERYLEPPEGVERMGNEGLDQGRYHRHRCSRGS